MSDEQIVIDLEPRDVLGKSVKHLRKNGVVPAVIHNHGKDSIIVQGDGVTMLKVFRKAGKNHTVNVTAKGKTYVTLIKDADFDPVKQTLSHIVFNAVSADQKVEAEIPVHAKFAEGNETTPAERAGLMVLTNEDVVLVEAVPSKLPDAIYYDAEKLVNVGDHVLIGDLEVPEGVEIIDDPNKSVVTVFEPSAVAAANDAAGGDAEEEVAETADAEGEAGTEATEVKTEE